jgi:AraC-like DNA-binding protein
LCDQAHFSRMFRRIVGESPRLWRRQFASELALGPSCESAAH